MNSLQNLTSRSSVNGLVSVCADSCKKLVARLRKYKTSLLREFGQNAFNQQHLVQLALNEAEALAYDSGFPLLTFPLLAREKAEAVSAWRLQQQTVRRTSFGRLAA